MDKKFHVSYRAIGRTGNKIFGWTDLDEVCKAGIEFAASSGQNVRVFATVCLNSVPQFETLLMTFTHEGRVIKASDGSARSM